jgi:hypothetical protein
MLNYTALSGGGVRCTYYTVDSSASVITLVANWRNATTATTVYLDNLTRSNVPPTPASANGLQANYVANVRGSARSVGSIELSHASAGLGPTFVYTAPVLSSAGYVPNLRQWVDAGSSGATADTAAANGSYLYASGGTLTFLVPVSLLPPGPYLLAARAKTTSGTAKSISVSTSTTVGTSNFANATGTQASDPVPTGGYSLVPLGLVNLPSKNVGRTSSSAVEQIVLSNITGQSTAGVVIDDLYAFWVGDGAALTQVDLGSGTPAIGAVHSQLFLDAPSVANGGTWQVYAGTQTDRSDSIDWSGSVVSWGQHRLSPGPASIFVVSAAARPTLRYKHRPAWMHTAVQVS